MKTIDLLILLPLGWGAYQGYQKGLLMEFATVFAFIAATVGSFALFEEGVSVLKPLIGEDNTLVPLITILSIFALILVGVHLLGQALKKFIDITILGTVDSIGGGILGLLKWAFALSVILWLTDKANISLPKEATKDALLYPIVVNYSPVLLDVASSIFPFSQDLVKNLTELLRKK